VHYSGIVPGLVRGDPLFLFQDGDVREPAAAQGACDRDADDAPADDAYAFSH
jgi:hypothetical protein